MLKVQGFLADIKKGVEYLQKAGNHKQAKEELGKYKKTLFGKWVRRQLVSMDIVKQHKIKIQGERYL